MRIATWNVNSVKARHERLLAWLQRHEPDVLCLQELKGVEKSFPFEAVEALGYHAAVYGQPTYNGVAILSRDPPSEFSRGFSDGWDEQARLITAKFGALTVVNVYVPNGQMVDSEKFEYKIEWLRRFNHEIAERFSPDEELVVVGDFNCAPDDRDVNRPEQWGDGVLCHQKVRDSVEALKAWGMVDVFRQHESDPGFYSWWDYRRLGFPKNNGLRIDLILATKAVAERTTGCWIDRPERKGSKPSDHVPVVVDW